MKKLRKQAYKVEIILCCFLLLTATINVNASESTYVSDSGEQFEYVVEDGYARLTAYWVLPGRDTPAEIRVPKELGGYPLKEIGLAAFDNWNTIEYQGETYDPYDKDKVQRIVIPEGVTTLKDGAFTCCHDVSEISLPSTLDTIETGFAFQHVTAEIVLAEENQNYIVNNGFLIDKRTDALLYCAPSAKDQPLPMVKRIEAHALDNYGYFHPVLTFPETVEYIGGFNAYDLVDLKTIVVSESVVELADYAFYCNSATSIELNEGLKRIGAYAFAETDIDSIVVPSTVEWIGFDAFSCMEEENIIVLNPNCVWETEEEYNLRHENE
jgi:hypothetical protein